MKSLRQVYFGKKFKQSDRYNSAADPGGGGGGGGGAPGAPSPKSGKKKIVLA